MEEIQKKKIVQQGQWFQQKLHVISFVLGIKFSPELKLHFT